MRADYCLDVDYAEFPAFKHARMYTMVFIEPLEDDPEIKQELEELPALLNDTSFDMDLLPEDLINLKEECIHYDWEFEGSDEGSDEGSEDGSEDGSDLVENAEELIDDISNSIKKMSSTKAAEDPYPL